MLRWVNSWIGIIAVIIIISIIILDAAVVALVSDVHWTYLLAHPFAMFRRKEYTKVDAKRLEATIGDARP